MIVFILHELNPVSYFFSLPPEDSSFQCEASSARNDTSRRMSSFEGTSKDGRRSVAHHDSMSKLCEDIANRIETRIKQHRDLLEHYKLVMTQSSTYTQYTVITGLGQLINKHFLK